MLSKLRLDKTPRQGKAQRQKGMSCVAACEEGRRKKIRIYAHRRSRYAGKDVVLKIE